MRQRIEWIDCLRGFTMLLVVFSHVIKHLFEGSSEVNFVFLIFRMPLFFFLSGFLSYAVYNKSLYIKRIKNRLLYQLLPTIASMLLFMWLFRSNLKWDYLLMDPHKSGYWFTIVVVEAFFTYMLLVAPLHRHRIVQLLIMVMLGAASWVCWNCGIDQLSPIKTAAQYCCFQLYLQYLLFFFMGVIFKMYLPQISRCIANGWAQAALVIAFCALFMVETDQVLLKTIQRLIGVVLMFRLFEYFSATFSRGTRIGRSLAYIGRFTLEIYLLHYFVIWSMKGLKGALDMTWVDASWISQLIVYGTIALIVTGLCLLAANALRVAPPLYHLFLGRMKPREDSQRSVAS